MTITAAEQRFASRILRRRQLFLVLSLAGVAVAAGLAGYYAWRRATDPDFPLGARAVIVVLVLLNARQNLRQYRIAGVLRGVLGSDGTP
jgi:hypothetical protein